jgi:hypothetical protein
MELSEEKNLKVKSLLRLWYVYKSKLVKCGIFILHYIVHTWPSIAYFIIFIPGSIVCLTMDDYMRVWYRLVLHVCHRK